MITYKDVLEQIKNKTNHLLIGNGFNRSLGVNTGYKAIFEKMIENKHDLYNDAKVVVEDSNYDLEIFIGKQEETISSNNQFLKKYIRNKIKFDFMKAAHSIVKEGIKNVYAEQNEGVFILLNNFTTYFSLNYDSLLYLLLLKYKPLDDNSNNVVAFEPTLKFIEDDLNERQSNIYTDIKSIRENGLIDFEFNDGDNVCKELSSVPKTQFTVATKEYSKKHSKGWRSRDIEKVVEIILKEEEGNSLLNSVDDGIHYQKLFDDFVFRENCETQNLFFLHGAFHIYEHGKLIKKITQQADKALYDRLEEILDSEGKNIVCVFQSEDKLSAIKPNEYLNNCFKRLGELEGDSLVIIGSAMSENDNHIFEQVNKSKINKIYISSIPETEKEILKRANEVFPQKEVYIFDALSITYDRQQLNEEDTLEAINS